MATPLSELARFPSESFSEDYEFKQKSHKKAKPTLCNFRLCTYDGTSKPFLQDTIFSVLHACKGDSQTLSLIHI